MDVKTILLCLAAVIGHASSYDSYYEKPFSYTSGSESKEGDGDGSSGELKSSELMYSGEYEGDDQPFPSFRDEYVRNGAEPTDKNGPIRAEPFESGDGYEGESFEDGEVDRKYEPLERKYETAGGSPSGEPSTNSKDQVTRATERDKNLREDVPKPLQQGKESHWNDKAISPISTNNHYTGFPKKPDDVEVILPQEKTLFLPLINGKPKPYDGYRAAPKTDSLNVGKGDKVKESPEQRERRLTLGEIIYGKPRVALGPKHLLQKRSATEYNGGIQPHYDFSDSKLTWTAVKTELPRTETTLKKRGADYPDDFYATSHDDFFRSFKSQLEAGDKGRKNDHSFYSEESYEASSEETGEPDESRYESTYASDNEFKIAHATIKVFALNDNPKDNQEEKGQDNERKNRENGKVLPYNSGTFIGLPETAEETLNSTPHAWNLEQPENMDQDHEVSENTHKIPRSIDEIKLNEKANLKRKRSKRSAKDAHNLDSFPQSGRESGRRRDDNFDFERFSRAKANLRIDYKRPNLFNFQPTNKKYTSSSGFSGYNTYNIYNRPKSLVNWNGSTKQSHSVNSERESSKSHGGSFTYKVPEKSYGVPASIYEDLFQSSEKIDEPYDNVKEKEYSKNHEYSQRAFSTSRYYNQYNTKQSQRNEKHSNPQHNYKSHSFSQRNVHSEHRYRPKKNAQQDKFRVRGHVNHNEKGGDKDFKTGKPDKRKPQEFPASESRLALNKQFSQEPSPSDVEKSDAKDPCKRERRGEMLCTVCTNEKTSATYEQCQFSAKSRESEKYYEYKKQESGNSPMHNKIKENTDPSNKKPTSHQVTMAIFKGRNEGQESMTFNTPPVSSGTRNPPSTNFHTSSNIFLNPDPKRFLRKTERRQATGDEDSSDYGESEHEADESDEEGSSGMMGNDGLTFGSFGDDFSKAFVEFGRHATEDMFHRGFSGEGFSSDDKFDFDALSFEERDDEEGTHSEEDFSF